MNFNSLGNKQEGSKSIYKTYIKQAKFGAMVHGKEKKKSKPRHQTTNHSFFGKLINISVRGKNSSVGLGLKDLYVLMRFCLKDTNKTEDMRYYRNIS